MRALSHYQSIAQHIAVNRAGLKLGTPASVGLSNDDTADNAILGILLFAVVIPVGVFLLEITLLLLQLKGALKSRRGIESSAHEERSSPCSPCFLQTP